MAEFTGKRLLILGATGIMRNAIETAKSLGCYTIATDYFPDAAAKKYADKSYDVSTLDIDALERLAREEKIDGVLTGYSEQNLYAALDLCERLGLPFYATREQLDQATDKLKFKEMCRRHGVPTVRQFELDARCLPEHLIKIKYPVIVKPADGCAGKGISVCYDEDALKKGVDTALYFSNQKRIIVEEYLDPRNYDDFCVYYTISEGDIRLSAMCDRILYIDESGSTPVPMQLRMPSKHLDLYMQSGTDEKVRNMFRRNKYHSGTLFMQGVVANGQFCFFEMGFRMCGAQEHVFISHANKNNFMQLYISHALTGTTQGYDMKRENPAFGCACGNLVILLSPGRIVDCRGMDEVSKMPGVLNASWMLKPGDTVGPAGTLGQVFARIHITGDTWKQVDERIQIIMDTLEVKDEKNKNLIIRMG